MAKPMRNPITCLACFCGAVLLTSCGSDDDSGAGKGGSGGSGGADGGGAVGGGGSSGSAGAGATGGSGGSAGASGAGGSAGTAGSAGGGGADSGVDAAQNLMLTVVVEGRGRVTSNPPMVDCPGTCTVSVPPSTMMTLTATEDAISTFTSWSESGCSGATCDVTVTADRTVTATFTTEAQNYAFVSSTQFAASFGGVAGADAECQKLATDADLPGTYVAWISDTTSDAIDRIPMTAGGWLRTDGRPFALSRAALLAGELLHPLRVTETGQDMPMTETVFTNTMETGVYGPIISNIDACADWTSADSSLHSVGLGASTSTKIAWTRSVSTGCANMARLYCLGVTHDSSTSPAPPNDSGRTAFLVTDVSAAGGVAGFDAACASAASAESLSGSFKALVSTASESAASRFSGTTPWVRVDGVRIADSAADVLSGNLVAPINVTAARTYEFWAVWGGALTPADTTATPATESCTGWTGAGTAIGGDSNSTFNGDFGWFRGNTLPCGQVAALYCLEE